jgi:hypothetical protein
VEEGFTAELTKETEKMRRDLNFKKRTMRNLMRLQPALIRCHCGALYDTDGRLVSMPFPRFFPGLQVRPIVFGGIHAANEQQLILASNINKPDKPHLTLVGVDASADPTLPRPPYRVPDLELVGLPPVAGSDTPPNSDG